MQRCLLLNWQETKIRKGDGEQRYLSEEADQMGALVHVANPCTKSLEGSGGHKEQKADEGRKACWFVPHTDSRFTCRIQPCCRQNYSGETVALYQKKAKRQTGGVKTTHAQRKKGQKRAGRSYLRFKTKA